MAATLTIDRTTNLSLADLVIGTDSSTGYTLDPEITLGAITWRKQTSESPYVPGRTFNGTFTRETTVAAGSITCHGTDEEDLQDQIEVLVAALTQIVSGAFAPFGMTYTHGAAVYSWSCTEPADITPGGVQDHLDDAQMASFVQPFSFVVVRHPIPTAGPI